MDIETRRTQSLDTDTLTRGHDEPFDYWEHDHTGLVHVLWAAKHRGLTLSDNADEIASMIMHSRWLSAQRKDAEVNGFRR